MKSKEQLNAYHNQWHKENTPGPGVIGEVPKLALGAINPMWDIEANIEDIAKRGAEALLATDPKKQKIISVDGILKKVDEDEIVA